MCDFTVFYAIFYETFFVAFFSVKFSCLKMFQCKKGDKYQVCTYFYLILPLSILSDFGNDFISSPHSAVGHIGHWMCTVNNPIVYLLVYL